MPTVSGRNGTSVIHTILLRRQTCTETISIAEEATHGISIVMRLREFPPFLYGGNTGLCRANLINFLMAMIYS